MMMMMMMIIIIIIIIKHVINPIMKITGLRFVMIPFSNNAYRNLIELSGINSQENASEQNSHNNHSDQHGREDTCDDDKGAGDYQTKLQERVHVEGKHSVHFLLIFGETVENSPCWGRVEEAHGTGQNLTRENKQTKNLYY